MPYYMLIPRYGSGSPFPMESINVYYTTSMYIKIPVEGWTLLNMYAEAPYTSDGHYAGVLAEYLEEHIDKLVRNDEERKAVQSAIAYLYRAYNHPDRRSYSDVPGHQE